MSDERNQNWKAESIAKYAELEAYRKSIENDLANNSTINKLNEELETARTKLIEAEKPYYERINGFLQQQAGIKLELVDTWGDTEEKTFECDAGTATLRTTKSLNIRSKEKLVEFLAILGKLPEFIKTFETAKLRKIKEAGLLEDEVATWDEKRSIAIKIAEADQ